MIHTILIKIFLHLTKYKFPPSPLLSNRTVSSIPFVDLDQFDRQFHLTFYKINTGCDPIYSNTSHNAQSVLHVPLMKKNNFPQFRTKYIVDTTVNISQFPLVLYWILSKLFLLFIAKLRFDSKSLPVYDVEAIVMNLIWAGADQCLCE